MGRFLAGLGMTPMAGRMWGYLLICEPPEQTAAQIAEALQASRGSVMLASAGAMYRQMREIAERGLAVTEGRAPEARERLQEFHDVMAFVEQEVPRVVSQFLRERAKARKTGSVYPVRKEA